MTITRGGNEEVDMRRTIAMATQLVEQLLGRSVRRAAITRRHDAARTVAAFGIGDDTSAQVVVRLGAVEVRIGALGVGMPQVHHGASHRLALLVQDTALEEHHRARIQAVVHPYFAFGHRCAGYIQRPFDGARSTAADAGFGILGIQLQVQVVFDAQPGHQQAGFLARTQAVEVIHRLPEFIRGDLQVFDDAGDVVDDTVGHQLHARATLVVVQATDFFEEFLDIGSVSNLHGHDMYLELLLSALRVQRSSLWIDDGWRHRPSISMSM
ncbi:hypothetical protein D3C72_1533210 [compost metagenome]